MDARGPAGPSGIGLNAGLAGVDFDYLVAASWLVVELPPESTSCHGPLTNLSLGSSNS